MITKMIVLSMPCSFGPQNLLDDLVSNKACSIGTWKNLGPIVASVATLNTEATRPITDQPKSLFQINKFQELSEILIKNDKPRSKNECCGGLKIEVASIIQRLEAFGERVMELETEKFKNKIKGSEMSLEESVLVEDLSREMARKFLEEPIQFLTSEDGDLQEKLKEMKFLVDILEESLSGKGEREGTKKLVIHT